MLDFLDKKREYYISNDANDDVMKAINNAIECRDFIITEGFYSKSVVGDLSFTYNEISNQEVLDTMIIHLGDIWGYLFTAEFNFNNKQINARLVERELGRIDSLIKSFNEPDEFDTLFMENGKNDGANSHAIEYLRIKNEYYIGHRLLRTGFFTSIAYVYGKYFMFYDYLNSLLNGINNKFTNRQHALYFFYSSINSEYEKRSNVEYAEALKMQLQLQTVKSFANQYSSILDKDKRRENSNTNISDLKKVREKLADEKNYRPHAIKHLDNDLIIADS